MSEDSALFVEELFQKYRKNFETLESLFIKKGIELPSVSSEIKIEKETFYSNSLWYPKVDLAMHTCGLRVFPAELAEQGQSTYLPNDSHFTEKQMGILSNIFDHFQVNIDIFRDATQNAKGLWIEYLQNKYMEIYLKTKPRPNWDLNFTGQPGDVLVMLIPNFKEKVTEIAYSKDFRKIPETDRPRGRMAEISKYFLKLFSERYYKCEHFKIAKCIICNSGFYPQSRTEWINRVPPVFCEICLTMGFSASTDFNKRLGFTMEERKENYREGIKIYSEYFGFIPPVGYQKRKVIQQLNQSGISLDELVYAMKVSSLLPWTETVKVMFVSWAHLLEESGLLSERKRGFGGHQSIASDGHLCLSMGERAICEFLTKNEVKHEKEPSYPFDEKLNPNNLLRGDFLINGLIIEFAGMMNNPDYAARMKIKEKLAASHKIPWLKLENSKLDDLYEMLDLINSKLMVD